MIDGTETDDTDWQKKTTPNEIVRQICPFKVAPPQVGGCRVSAEYHRFQIVAFGQSRISERRLITGTGLFFSPMFVRGTVGGDRQIGNSWGRSLHLCSIFVFGRMTGAVMRLRETLSHDMLFICLDGHVFEMICFFTSRGVN